ncbi:MAG: alpha/beta hydrolase [Propionibacteriales bacterium]|nr:alpha/beta hydrolase [Propionibacteriales bacterium]
MSQTPQTVTSHLLERPEGRLSYVVRGEGPLVICLPGMGDVQATFRFLTPALAAAGYRAVTMDLRGHGDSDATFTTYDDGAAAGDLVALIEQLGGPAILLGNSMGAAAVAMAAARRPDLVTGLVLVGPFVRDRPVGLAMRILFRITMAPMWARAVWRLYLPTLYAGRHPDDFDAHRAAIMAALRKPGHTRAFSQTTHTAHAPAEALLGSVRAPSLVVMGVRDPDFTDPRAEADWIASRLGSEVVMVDDAGHYPHSQQPDVVNPAVIGFADRVSSGA